MVLRRTTLRPRVVFARCRGLAIPVAALARDQAGVLSSPDGCNIVAPPYGDVNLRSTVVA
ncbi:hypothetical protein PR002_g23077 [Phytophthora rubi]|uniref:Uncharacterized protein n=1 Tax=Phytophthora rubi TaxID=129364 RepID=A0A6A3IPN4_9STRA|nr:hypothetical protein PR002_g23077 [Phytophthora rubi]